MKELTTTVFCVFIVGFCFKECSSTNITELTGKNGEEEDIMVASFLYMTDCGTFKCSTALIHADLVLVLRNCVMLYSKKDYHFIKVVDRNVEHPIENIYLEDKKNRLDMRKLAIIRLSYAIRREEFQEWMQLPMDDVLRQENPTCIRLIRSKQEDLNNPVLYNSPFLELNHDLRGDVTVYIDAEDIENEPEGESMGGFLFHKGTVIGVAFFFQIGGIPQPVFHYTRVYDHMEFIYSILYPTSSKRLRNKKHTVVPF